MMRAAERHGELIADLAPHCAGLCEPQMVCIRRPSPAHQAGLRCDKLSMSLIPFSSNLAEHPKPPPLPEVASFKLDSWLVFTATEASGGWAVRSSSMGTAQAP